MAISDDPHAIAFFLGALTRETAKTDAEKWEWFFLWSNFQHHDLGDTTQRFEKNREAIEATWVVRHPGKPFPKWKKMYMAKRR